MKRQREALIRLREDSLQKDEDNLSLNLPPPVKRHHLSVRSAKAKSAKQAAHVQAQSSSSQQRHRQLQFLRHVHSAQTRLNDKASVKAPEAENIYEAG